MPYWVYILRCVDGSYYTGRTTDIDRRVSEHEHGINCRYTKNRRPVKLMNCWQFEREEDAYSFERQVKGWTRRKKEALIREDWNALVELSKTAQKHHG